ncbi:MAG: hypothetical protein LBU32_31265 [Clostridiales bacterium]|nr:hypothetical protein [Clostridiales bacterium]
MRPASPSFSGAVTGLIVDRSLSLYSPDGNYFKDMIAVSNMSVQSGDSGGCLVKISANGEEAISIFSFGGYNGSTYITIFTKISNI